MTTIAIIGGTGPEGRGLGLRFAMAEHTVFLGSRDNSKAEEAARRTSELCLGITVDGKLNSVAARAADWIVLSTPYDGLTTLLRELAPVLAGKLVISVISAITFQAGHPSLMELPMGSVARQIASLLPASDVVSAFHHVSAHDLLVPERSIQGDIIVCGDSDDAKAKVMALVEQVRSVRAIDGGNLDNSHYTEEFTAFLLDLNRRYKTRTSVKLLGI